MKKLILKEKSIWVIGANSDIAKIKEGFIMLLSSLASVRGKHQIPFILLPKLVLIVIRKGLPRNCFHIT